MLDFVFSRSRVQEHALVSIVWCSPIDTDFSRRRLGDDKLEWCSAVRKEDRESDFEFPERGSGELKIDFSAGGGLGK